MQHLIRVSRARLLLLSFFVIVAACETTLMRGSSGPKPTLPRDVFTDARATPAAWARAKAQVDRLRARHMTMTSATPDLSGSAWRWVGPNNVGGRVRALAINPANPSFILAGSAGGGLWKSTDSGSTWQPVDDFLPVLSISSIVFNPANPNIVYAGTGEPFANSDSMIGDGIYKSTDGGLTWAQLPGTANNPTNQDFGSFFSAVYRVAISPDGNVLLVMTNSGIFRSTDGGASFTRLVDKNGITVRAGTTVVFDPTDSTKAVADGGGVFIYTTDGGQTWQPASGPAVNGRIELAYARTDPNIVYASGDLNGGSFFRSTDGGHSYTMVYDGSSGGLLGVQGFFANVVWVDPTNANHVLVGGQDLSESFDGGSTWSTQIGRSIHADHHAIVADPRFDGVTNRTVYFGNDGGVYKIDDLAAQSSAPAYAINNNLGDTQFYGAAVDPSNGTIIGGTQDNGVQRWQRGNGLSWTQIGGGDGAKIVADPSLPGVFYGGYPYLALDRFTNDGNQQTPIYSGIADAGNGTRTSGIAPITLDPNNPRVLLAGGKTLWRTTDVTAPSPSWTAMRSSTSSEEAVAAIAIAPGNSDIVWVGYSRGSVYKTTNGTAASPTWMQITVPDNRMGQIAISPVDSNIVYVGSLGFNNTVPPLVKTSDGGSTWTSASGTGASALPYAPVRDIALNPADPNTIYVAGDMGVFVSHDAGGTWDVTDGYPNVRTDQLFWSGSTLYAVTHGRGVFAMDGATATPALAITPGSVTFGNETVGQTSATRGFVLSNAGGGTVSISSVALGGVQPADFAIASDGCTGAALSTNSTCAIEVAFKPTVSGPRSAVVIVTDSAPGSPQSLPVSGTGVPAASGVLPSPWTDGDIGAVGVAGSAAFANGTFTVKGAGGGIDQGAFHYVYQPVSARVAISAHVATLQDVNADSQAGIMVRSSLDPSSSFVALFVTAGNGVQIKTRDQGSGQTTSRVISQTGAAPVWLRIVETDPAANNGNFEDFYTSPDGSAWTLVASMPVGLLNSHTVGLAVSSHDTTTVASGTFDQVFVGAADALPAPWTQMDIGSVAIRGSAKWSNGTFTIQGSGADIWGTADAFHFVSQPLTGDGTIVARVAGVQNLNAWVKTGVMLRASADPGSAHAAVYVTPGKGIALQWRASNGGTSQDQQVPGAAPQFVRLVRAGTTVTASYSADGSTWATIAAVPVDLPATALAGLPISSHDNTQLATSTIDSVSVIAAGALPPGWTQQDIGSVALAGSATFSSGVFTLKGSGADIWGTADAFHFVSQPLNGDGTIAARVATVQNLNAWVKTGVMLRASVDPSAAHVAVYVTPGKGIALQWRASSGGVSQDQQVPGAAPQFVRLVRSGTTVTAAYSSDGSTWTTINAVTVDLPQTVLAGLPISSHDNTQLATSTIDSVGVTSAAGGPPPSPWTQADIGNVGFSGSGAYANGTFTIQGSGADIWNSNDAFHFVYQAVTGDRTIVARVVSVQNLNAWVKTGVMLRGSIDAVAGFVAVYVTPGKGIAMQWRDPLGGPPQNIQVPGVAPQFVRIVKSGGTFTGSYSADGTTWTTISTVSILSPDSYFAGLPICSHDNTQLATAKIDNVVIR